MIGVIAWRAPKRGERERILARNICHPVSYVLSQCQFIPVLLKTNMSRVVWLFTFCTCLAKQPLKIEIPDQGIIVGTEMSMVARVKRIRAFLGIPYAQPPLGQLRFAPPVTEPLPSWDGVRYANETAPACLQSSRDNNPQDMPFLNMIYFNKTYPMDEDCLYLNVYAPLGKYPYCGLTTMLTSLKCKLRTIYSYFIDFQCEIFAWS